MVVGADPAVNQLQLFLRFAWWVDGDAKA